MIEKVNLAEKLAAVGEPWQPKIVAELNDAYVKVVKFDGEFVWHHHDDEDELFSSCPAACACSSATATPSSAPVS